MPFGSPLLRRLSTLVWRIAVLAAVIAIAKTAWQYSTFEDDVAFLELKQEYIQNHIWKTAFYIHVFSSSLTLLAGLSQFSSTFLKRHRTSHRFLGYFYVLTVLLINVPSALVMSIYANGGIPSKVAFLVLDILWFWFTWNAVLQAKRGNIEGHKAAMIRSYALTCSALTLRLWILFLVGLQWPRDKGSATGKQVDWRRSIEEKRDGRRGMQDSEDRG